MWVYCLLQSTDFCILTNIAIWVQWWTNSNIGHPNERLGYWLGVFAALGVLAVISCVVADRYEVCKRLNTQLTLTLFSLFNLIALPRTSAKFHKVLLDTTMRYARTISTLTDKN